MSRKPQSQSEGRALRRVCRLGIVAFGILALSCGQTPAPSNPGETVRAGNRLGWDQAAADTTELAAMRFVVYVDGARSELTGVSCGTEATSSGYVCSAPVPPMTTGRHQLQLAAYVVDSGNVLESARSAAIEINFVSGITAPAPQQRDASNGSGAPVASATANLRTVADGLDDVTDLAFAPDGRLFVAERSGRVRVVRDGRLVPEPALEIRSARERLAAERPDRDAVLALAFDPQFGRTHFVYVLCTATSRRGTPSFVVARYREAGDTLADRSILLDDVPAARSDPAGVLRIGLDGKLYVAFDDSGDWRLAGDLASPNGKVLRLNTDGTTPDDQAGGSPLFSFAYRSPRGLDWDAESGVLWTLDQAGEAAQLSAVAATAVNGRKRGTTRATIVLPGPLEPSGLVFFQDSVLTASIRGNALLRSRIDPRERTRIVDTEPLLESLTEAVPALTIGPDGAVYFATARTVRRLALP